MGKDYIDRGDRVIIVGDTHANGSSVLAAHQGKHGVVLSNDGFGLCEVRLDDGTIVTAWNSADLKREGE